MSALMLLGVTYADSGLPASTVAHKVIHSGRLMGLAVEVESDIEPKDQLLVQWATMQNELLCGYVATQDVVPVALGSIFSSREALESFLQVERENISTTLRDFSDHVEYGLRVEARTVEPVRTAAPHGAAFLRQRKHERDIKRRRTRDRQSFVAQLVNISRKTARNICTTPQSKPARLLDVALLVHRAQVATLITQIRVHSQCSNSLELNCRLVGPSPAFSFVPGHLRHG